MSGAACLDMPPITDPKVLAAAAKHFDKFHESEVLADILDNFASICDLLVIQPGNFVNFYPELKVNSVDNFLTLYLILRSSCAMWAGYVV